MSDASASSPLEALAVLTARRANGELVVAGPAFEIRVYMRRGRVAWATNSIAPNALLHHIEERCHIARDELLSIADECRLTGRRFGETLIRWNLATWNDVRAALGAQISETIAMLSEFPDNLALFVPKSVNYWDDLTFELSEVAPALASPTRSDDGSSASEETNNS